MRELIIKESGKKVYNFIREFVGLCTTKTLVVSTTTRFNIENQPQEQYENIVNLKRINDIRRINKFFEAVNAKLPIGGIFISNAETYSLRKHRILKKYPPVLNWMVYTIDFIIKRVFPKIKFTKKIYFFLTRGNNRVISKAETLGRLYSCGFEILEEKDIDNTLYFVVKKIKQPAFDYHPTYGPLIRLKRVGKNGRVFNVYKMRTMHAYSEYLQPYIFEKNHLQEGGKFDNDFRITTLGKIMRKVWIDELPMLINLAKGDMKIVGVRPLSQHYFDLYTEELKQKRIQYRPGLIPPFYAHMPKTLEEIMDSEMQYLQEYDKHPIKTDVKYFFKAWNNILFNHARSN
ncbi:MAG: sugar transferase [Bacteroidales bacterium]|nr:sugar transferase [Bacteroidales bacterium]